MKKIFCLLMFVLLCTGCSVEYSILIEDGVVIESTNLIMENNEDNDSLIANLITYGESSHFDRDTANSYPYEMKEFLTNDNKLGLNYFYEFNYNDYVNSNAFTQCFDKRTFIYDNSYINLTTNEGIKCMYQDGVANFDELVITVESIYVVLDHNADSVDDDVYKWVVTPENYKDKSVEISFDRENTLASSNALKADQIAMYVIYILLGIALVFVLIFLYKFKRANKHF